MNFETIINLVNCVRIIPDAIIDVVKSNVLQVRVIMEWNTMDAFDTVVA